MNATPAAARKSRQPRRATRPVTEVLLELAYLLHKTKVVTPESCNRSISTRM